MKPHCMIDLETLSLKPNAVILSIGAAAFDMEEVAQPFHAILNIKQQRGRHIDPGTVMWWMQQSDDARKVFGSEAPPVGLALARLNGYIEQHCPSFTDRQIWGNGSDFDNVLLKNLYEWQNKMLPWSHHGNRCFRTLKNLSKQHYEEAVSKVARVTHHNAADDARWQAEVCRRLLKKMEAAYGVCDAAAVLCNPDGELSCIPDGPERKDLENALGVYEHA